MQSEAPPQPAPLFLQDPGRRSTGLQVQVKISFCIAAEDHKGRVTNRFFPRDAWGGGGGLPCDVSLTPKKYRFFTVDNLLLARA